MSNILDRRNELAGNLSLNQEIYFIEKINEWVRHGRLSGTKHEIIEVKWIRMLHDLDAESKLNRSPSFIQGLMHYGEQQAEVFLGRTCRSRREDRLRHSHIGYWTEIRRPDLRGHGEE